MARLQGRHVMVTGAAQGIGRAIAVRAAAEGAAVAALDINANGIESLTEEILASGGSAVAIVADLTSVDESREAIETAGRELGGLDGLVNNAGVLFEEPIGEISEDAWALTLAVNLTAPWRLTQLVLPWFDKAKGGSIVNISSIEGLRVRERHAAYAATKGALLQLTRTTAVELGHRNIRANAVCPGSIDSEMFREHVAALEDPESVLKDLISRNHLGRLGTPDEVAISVTHLLSDESAFTTGQHYVIDGGRIVST